MSAVHGSGILKFQKKNGLLLSAMKKITVTNSFWFNLMICSTVQYCSDSAVAASACYTAVTENIHQRAPKKKEEIKPPDFTLNF